MAVSENSSLVQKFFKDLEDPTLYERVDDVPIFGKHTKKKKAPDGTWHTVKVEDEDLQEIGDACDEMEAKGSLPVITAGHRKLDPRIDEQDQPQPWGYMRWLRPGFYTSPDGRRVKTLLCTQYLKKDVKAKGGMPANKAARTFPFRSVDYYADTHEITGLALLRRDPELDLGLISYGKTGRPFFLYASENMMPEMKEGAVPPTDAPNADHHEPGENMDEDDLSPDEAMQCMRYARHMTMHHPAFKYMCDRYASEQVGDKGVGDMPADDKIEPDKMKPDKMKDDSAKEPEMHERNGMTPEQYQRELAIRDKAIDALTKRAEANEVRIAAAEKNSRLSQYSAELERLQVTEHLEFDVPEELAIVQDHTPEQFQAHVKRLQKICRKAPIGKTGLQYERSHAGSNGGTEAGDGMPPQDILDRAFQYCRDHPNCQWPEAEAYARNGK